MKKMVFLITCLSLAKAFGQEVNSTPRIKSVEEIQVELEKAERDFQTAQKMFIPWYTGPLITGSANNVHARKVNVQIYLYNTIQYAAFNKHRKSIDVPNIYTINPLLLVQRGLNDWLDFTVIGQGFFKWRKGEHSSQFGDTTTSFGFQLATQTQTSPSVRFIIGEVYPTGKYQHLNPNKNGIDGTGAGAFQTSLGLNVSKIFWWSKLHPVNLRLATSYSIPDKRVKVKDFHAYGGGFGTRGKVKVGQSINVDIGIEVSLTQKWVFANDIAYTYSNKDSFSGFDGVTATGTPAANGAPSSDQLSLAPAIEYNISSNAGFIGGVWFTVTGRNSSNFVSVILSYTQLF